LRYNKTNGANQGSHEMELGNEKGTYSDAVFSGRLLERTKDSDRGILWSLGKRYVSQPKYSMHEPKSRQQYLYDVSLEEPMSWTFPVRKNRWDIGKKTTKKDLGPDPEWRLKGIGGSDAPVIMGATPTEWGNVIDLWKVKTGRAQPRPQNYPMERGVRLERFARKAYEKKTGIQMPADRKIHPELDFIRSHFDGVNWDLGKVLEIKCPLGSDHEIALSGKIPDKYIWQCVHLLLVSGLKNLDYFSYDGKEGVIIHFQKNGLLEEELLSKEIPFWKCVQKDVPPKLKEKKKVPIQRKNEVERVSSKEFVEFLDNLEVPIQQKNEVERVSLEEIHFQKNGLLEEELLSKEIPFWKGVQKDVPPKLKEKKKVPIQQKNEVERVSSKELVEFLDRAKEVGVTRLELNLSGDLKSYDLEEKPPYCSYHREEHVRGDWGFYCRECYLDRKNRRR
jgi:putative phage-type endonuclease